MAARLGTLVLGLFLFAAGIVALLESRLGLMSWDVLHQGLARHTPLSFGTANIAVGVVVLTAATALGARPGIGTVANAVLVGVFVDLLAALGAVSSLADAGLAARIVTFAAGLVLIGVGSALYMGAGLGAGPRDSLMIAATARSGRRVGVVRTVIEAAALGVGFVLGGTVGVGTLASALLLGPIVEASFSLLQRSPLAVPRSAADPTPGATAVGPTATPAGARPLRSRRRPARRAGRPRRSDGDRDAGRAA